MIEVSGIEYYVFVFPVGYGTWKVFFFCIGRGTFHRCAMTTLASNRRYLAWRIVDIPVT